MRTAFKNMQGVLTEADVRVFVTDSNVSLQPGQQFVEAIISGADLTVTLPPAALCAGMLFTLYCNSMGGSTPTVKFIDSESGSDVSSSLTATDDNCVVVSTGSRFIVLAETAT